MKPPPVVEGSPDIDWFSIDDRIWLSWRADGNLLEAHWPKTDIGKPHAAGWIDVTSGEKHRIVSLDPLTISGHSGSILCAQGCGFHGYVTDGHWRDA